MVDAHVTRPAVVAAGLLLCTAWAAAAQAQVPAAPAEQTVLSLTAHASLSAVPDRLGATMHATATGATAAAASAAVNRMVAQARQTARGSGSVALEAGGYQVVRRDPPDTRWEADQTLTIVAKDGGDAVLQLVGELQGQNLVTGDISWSLSPDAYATRREAAVQAALVLLRRQAAQAATALGLHVRNFSSVTIDDEMDTLRPEARPMLVMRAMAPTVDQPQQAVVQATVRGEAILSP